jgi:DNA-binding PadR family transcriptional regulator
MDPNVLSNMLVELKRGTQVLAVLSQLKQNQYGYSLLQALEEKGVSIEAGTLYPLMRRLESQGLLISEWDTTESRPRKYYRLSQDGLKIYESLIEEWQRMVIDMNRLMEEKTI